jgi:hypothetical protein
VPVKKQLELCRGLWHNPSLLNDIEGLDLKMKSLLPCLDERYRRLVAAAEARSLGHGGIAAVSRASGLSRTTIAAGIRELESDGRLEPGRVRQPE